VPRTLVTGLFRQIAPGKAMTDLLVEHSFDRADLLFTDMFEAARHGRVDLEAIDDEIDPVIRAVKVGGLRPWLELVRAHDDMTVRHCLLVAGLAAYFALHLGLSLDDRTSLVRGALVHDVGKAKIPLAILQKPSALDTDELKVMRTHAALGHELLVTTGMTDALALAVTRHHHEMLDGSGYPDGLSDASISDPVRLLTICDIYAALTEERPYRPAMTQAEAIAILKRMAPDRLEAPLVEAFAASLTDCQIGRGSSTPFAWPDTN
jgi:putative nucleotidyltransferase with HDIG domain